jgi:hypothetical protein
MSIAFVTAALFFTNTHGGSLPDVNKGGGRINDSVPNLRDLARVPVSKGLVKLTIPLGAVAAL